MNCLKEVKLKAKYNFFNRHLCKSLNFGIVAILIVLYMGCGGGGGGGDGNDLENNHEPSISEVRTLKVINAGNVLTHNFDIGDKVVFEVYSHDEDKDLATLIINQYYPKDESQPYYTPIELNFPTPLTEHCIVTPPEPIIIRGPHGNWRMELILVDSKGNESNSFVLYYQVFEETQPPDQNQPPLIDTIESKAVTVGQTLTFTVSATDPDGDPLTFSARSMPSSAIFNESTQTFSWVPTSNDIGEHTVIILVEDDWNPPASDTLSVKITVNSDTIPTTNQPPEFNPVSSKSVKVGDSLTFTVTATDPDGDPLTFSAQNLPSGATFNESTQTFNWTPSSNDVGKHTITILVEDDWNPPAKDTLTIKISVKAKTAVFGTATYDSGYTYGY